MVLLWQWLCFYCGSSSGTAVAATVVQRGSLQTGWDWVAALPLQRLGCCCAVGADRRLGEVSGRAAAAAGAVLPLWQRPWCCCGSRRGAEAACTAGRLVAGLLRGRAVNINCGAVNSCQRTVCDGGVAPLSWCLSLAAISLTRCRGGGCSSRCRCPAAAPSTRRIRRRRPQQCRAMQARRTATHCIGNSQPPIQA